MRNDSANVAPEAISPVFASASRLALTCTPIGIKC